MEESGRACRMQGEVASQYNFSSAVHASGRNFIETNRNLDD